MPKRGSRRRARVAGRHESRAASPAGRRARVAADSPPRPRARGACRIRALERLDGADQDGGRASGRLGDDVEAVVHAVDKVHVGDARRPEHDPVPGRGPHAGVRGPVLEARRTPRPRRSGRPGARPRHPRRPRHPGRAERRRIPDQAGAEQGARRGEGVAGEDLAGERACPAALRWRSPASPDPVQGADRVAGRGTT